MKDRARMSKARLAIAGAVFAFAAGPALASGDYSCSPVWKLAIFGGLECGDKAALTPGNDTRSNMFFLMRAGTATPPSKGPVANTDDWEARSFGRSFFSWGTLAATYAGVTAAPETAYGSRCDSVSHSASVFGQALAANTRLRAVERDALTQTRGNLAARCDGGAQPLSWPAISSAPGQAFLAYLQAADAFYAGNWATARDGFGSLRKAADPWVAETAAYMLIRVELNAAQEHAFDEYGDFQGASATDAAATRNAGAAIEAYLKRYPKGRYAASAQGLKRRVLWLGGDNAGLARNYEGLLSTLVPGSAESFSLIQEIDNKLLFKVDAASAIQTPQLLAAWDLMRMRQDGDETRPVLTAANLAAQKQWFARQPELYAYLRAAHAFYVGRDAGQTLALLPPEKSVAGLTPLAFSRQVLRGMALAQAGDPGEEAHWRGLIAQAKAPFQREAAELGLALMLQKASRLPDIFAAGSPIEDSTIREILLARAAGPDLLRMVTADRAAPRRQRDVALLALLQKNLATGRYADFQRDVAMVPANAAKGQGLWDIPSMETIPIGLFTAGRFSENYACSALRDTAAALARNPADPKAKLCLGEFWRLNGFDWFEALDPLEEPGVLGTAPGQFPGRRATRAVLYDAVMADPKAGPDEKAYALYRAVYCYAPSGNNDCGGEDVDVSQRRAWFQRLKKDYPASRWAKNMTIYW